MPPSIVNIDCVAPPGGGGGERFWPEIREVARSSSSSSNSSGSSSSTAAASPTGHGRSTAIKNNNDKTTIPKVIETSSSSSSCSTSSSAIIMGANANDNHKAATAAAGTYATTTTSRSSLKTTTTKTTTSTTTNTGKPPRRSLTVTVHMPVPLVRVDTTSSTFSSGTFHSLDGLSNSYKMVRTELRQRLEPRYEALLISRQRTPQQQPVYPNNDGRQRQRQRRQQHLEDELSLLKRRLVDKRSLSLSSQQSHCSSSINLRLENDDDDDDHRFNNHYKKNGTTKSSLSSALSSWSRTRKMTTTTTTIKKSVHFGAPLVTEIHHRPYTPTSDIAKLFFQEDELEMFAEDRSQDPGDVVECEYMEEAYAISVAYQRRQSIDD